MNIETPELDLVKSENEYQMDVFYTGQKKSGKITYKFQKDYINDFINELENKSFSESDTWKMVPKYESQLKEAAIKHFKYNHGAGDIPSSFVFKVENYMFSDRISPLE